MQPTMQRFAWILGVLGFLTTVATLLWWQATGTFDTTPSVLAGVSVLLLAAYAWLDRSRIGETAESRAVRHGSGAALLVLLVLGVAVAANILADRYNKRWDATLSKQFTLSDQSVSIVKGLDRKVQIVAFFASESPEESSFRDLVDGYRQHSTLLEIEFHDPLREPFLAQQFEVTNEVGTVVLQAGEDKQRLESKFDEESLTNALVRIAAGREHNLCFTTEHGELDPDDDMGVGGLGGAVMKLEGQNYKVEKLSILKEGGVPDRCEITVVAGPQVDLLPVEREAIARYLVDGGRAIFLMEPASADATAQDLSRYGVVLKNDLVLEDNPEARRIGLDPSFVVVGPDQLDFHPITNKIKAGLLFQTARSVAAAAPAPTGLNVQVLAHSTEAAWAETTLDGSVPAGPDEGVDTVGNVPLMAVVEITDPAAVPVKDTKIVTSPSLPLDIKLPDAPAPGADVQPEDPADPAAAADPALDAEAREDDEAENAPAATPPREKKGNGRLVVIGDASFASNQLLIQVMNQDLFLNSVAWLVGEEDQVSIRPNEAAKGNLEMSVAQGVIVWFLALLGIPGAAIAGAIAAWIQRRRQ